MKVLIVDDERDVELLFRQLFRKELKEGMVTFCFSFSGEEALAYLESLHPPDVMLILSDINMPGMTGLELLRKIKAHFGTMKVCMITAYNDESNYKAAMQHGADDYLTKPLDFGKLRRAIFEK